jgi:hypothetical protein
MGKLQRLYPHSQLMRLSTQQKKELQARLTREIRKDPMAAAIISAHRKMTALLKKKLQSTRS